MSTQIRSTADSLRSQNNMMLSLTCTALLLIYAVPARASRKYETHSGEMCKASRIFMLGPKKCWLDKGKKYIQILGWGDAIKKILGKRNGIHQKASLLLKSLEVKKYVGTAKTVKLKLKDGLTKGFRDAHWEMMLECEYDGEMGKFDCLVNIDFGPKKSFLGWKKAFQAEGMLRIQIIKKAKLDAICEINSDDTTCKEFLEHFKANTTPLIPSREFYGKLKNKFVEVRKTFQLSKLIDPLRSLPMIYSGFANSNYNRRVQNCQTVTKMIKEYCERDEAERTELMEGRDEENVGRKLSRWAFALVSYASNLTGIIPFARAIFGASFVIRDLPDWVLSKQIDLDKLDKVKHDKKVKHEEIELSRVVNMEQHSTDSDEPDLPEEDSDSQSHESQEALVLDPKQESYTCSHRRRLVILESITELSKHC